jgi:hypothetical protein
MNTVHHITEESLISEWLDLAGETFKEYGWMAPGTWGGIRQLDRHGYDNEGYLGEWAWVRPWPFAIKILMNPFAKEGYLYPAHAGVKGFEYVEL